MKHPLLILCSCALFFAQAFAGEKIVIDPITKGTGKVATGVKKSEEVTVSGPLQTVPMGGAMLTVQSANYGQLILFSPFDVEASAERHLRELEAAHVSVRISGTLNTSCSDRQLATEVMGCRRFDTTKAITIEKR
jgi:hypothetical protein